MSLKANNLTTIKYTKGEEITERVILPTSVPSNIKAIDATDLHPLARKELQEQYEEYSAYLKQHIKQAFSFEDWLSHTKDVKFPPKWRTFKPTQTEIIT